MIDKIKPINNLYTTANNDDIEDIISRCTRVLENFASESSHVTSIYHSSKGGIALHSAHSLYHRIVEQIDGMSALVANRCITPCHTLLRSATEYCILLHFILHADTDFRAASYFLSLRLAEKTWREKLDNNTDRGKELVAKAKKTNHDSIFTKNHSDSSDAIKRFNGIIRQKPFDAAWSEWTKDRKSKWYGLKTGYKSVEEVARSCDLSVLYELHYRYASGYVHGSQSEPVIGDHYEALRNPVGAGFVATTAHTIYFMSSIKMLQYFSPSHVDEYVSAHEKFFRAELEQLDYLDISLPPT